MYILISIAAAAFAALLLYGYCSNYFLKAERYFVSAPGVEPGKSIRIVMLTDLHGTSFGRENRRLIDAVRRECPDIICIAGDMTVKNGQGTERCLALCRELVGVCPVYYAAGNHEAAMEDCESFFAALRQTGVVFLDSARTDFFFRGKKFSVYGWSADEWYYHRFWEKRELLPEVLDEQLGVPDRDAYCILLAHNPEYCEAYAAWGADLVLSGHVHGGIARLPLAGGVIDPSLRLFPKYDAGRFQSGEAVMVLSRGLGTHHIRLRFFNPPELSVIDLGAPRISGSKL